MNRRRFLHGSAAFAGLTAAEFAPWQSINAFAKELRISYAALPSRITRCARYPNMSGSSSRQMASRRRKIRE